MKKYFAILAAIIIMLFMPACSSQTNTSLDSNSKNTKPTTEGQAQKAGFTEIEFGLAVPESDVLSQCYWYEGNSILLLFETPGENQRLHLFSLDLSTNNSKKMYTTPFTIECIDNFLMNENTLGYQNYEAALFFDRDTKKLIKKFLKPTSDAVISFSPNIEYLAIARESGLYVKEIASSQEKKVAEPSENYISLVWSEDNSKLAYITGQRSILEVIDIDSGKKQTLISGQDFQTPEGFVELMYCRFLPDNYGILLDVLCEEENAIVLLKENGKQRTITEDGLFSTLSVSGSKILYCLEENNSKERKLICYDYEKDTRKELFSSEAFITSASFSPDNKKIIFGTFLDGETKLYMCDVPQD